MSEVPSIFWFRMIAKDFLAETAHMTSEEKGVFITLRCQMWLRDDCTLPYNMKELAKLSLAKGRFKKIWPGIETSFGLVGGTKLTCRDLWNEHKETKEKVRRNKENGRKGGLAKSASENHSYAAHSPKGSALK
jgi:uncharacterized protein YdaU (DUF1376 family)